MKKIWNFIKKYLGFVASPWTLTSIFIIGVIIIIFGFIFGFGVLYEEIATFFSAFVFIALIPFAIILTIYGLIIHPILWFIKKKKKKNEINNK
jgi:membrane-bound ClpP family serine protease